MAIDLKKDCSTNAIIERLFRSEDWAVETYTNKTRLYSGLKTGRLKLPYFVYTASADFLGIDAVSTVRPIFGRSCDSVPSKSYKKSDRELNLCLTAAEKKHFLF